MSPPSRRSRRHFFRQQTKQGFVRLTIAMQGYLQKLFAYLRRWDRLLTLVLVLLWVGIIVVSFVIRGSYVFEGNLIVQEMSFTYTGEQDHLFLSTIRGIKALDVEGNQPEPFVLTGKFSSPTDPNLNQKLSQFDRLTIELPYTSSRLIVAPKTSSSSNLNLLELRINTQTSVKQLTYQTQINQLSFCLQSASESPTLCRHQGSAPERPASIPTPVGLLDMSLGRQTLTVDLALFNIPELGIQTDIFGYNELRLEVIPSVDQKLLTLLSPTHIYIGLPAIPPATNSRTADFRQWFWKDLDVTQVRFSQVLNTNSVRDSVANSTILSGEVRMQDQKMELQENQFLTVDSEPGIRKLRHIQLHPDQPQGLQTLISGESSKIEVGFYPEYPVQTIEPSWLLKYLSQEATNALLTFIAALTGVLLPRLLPDAAQKP
ncbi:MAG: hypothetical protein Kow00121_60230 [Elainellaceae cyanobacterium]